MDQKRLFDAGVWEARKEGGMARAEVGAGFEWSAEARSTVLDVARGRPEFTADDVWATGLPKPREPRALGAVMNALARAGLIVATGRYIKTAQASRNRAPIAVWRRGP